jgi:hypothetical protein
MAQTGYTPILIYASGTATNVPLAANLTSSASGAELGLNYADGKLYYKNSSGVVTLLASAAGAAGDVVGPASATDNALARFDTTTGKLIQNSVAILSDAGVLTGLTGLTSSGNVTLSSLTATRVPYASTGGLLVDSANMTFNGTRLTVADLADSGLTSGRVVYSTTGGALTDSANLLYSGTDLTVYGITVGRGAGAVSTNTAVGASALAANTTGQFNTVFGNSTGNAITTSQQNSFFGYQAGFKTTGGDNTGIGSVALYNNTSGGQNTAVGRDALLNTTTASFNTAVGYQAGLSNTTGQPNNAFGAQALYTNTTGVQNAAFGTSTLYANTTGANNTAVGNGALQSNTTASNNTAVGYQAAYANTTGSSITAVGVFALGSNTTGLRNTATGENALASNTTGADNAAFGRGAAAITSTGSFNSAFGKDALYSNTTASSSTAVGYQAGYSNTTGTINTYIGEQAGFSNQTGSQVTYLGRQAGYSCTVGGNTFVGAASGYNVTTGTKNTFVGGGDIASIYPSGFFMTTGSANTILGNFNGNQGGLDIRTANNYIVLSDGDGNPRGIFDGSGNFQVGGTTNYGPGKIAPTFNGTTTNGISLTETTDTDGSAYLAFRNSSGVAVGTVTRNGASAVAYNTSSDYRLKNTIAPMTGALARVALLRPVTYKWNADGSDGEGFIAHELAEVCPDAVTGAKDAVDPQGKPQYQGIDTGFLVATLTAAIQELKAEFDAYKASHP